MYWPEQDSTTVVKQSSILEPTLVQLTVGCDCTVKLRTGRIEGIVKLYLIHVHVLYHPCMSNIKGAQPVSKQTKPTYKRTTLLKCSVESYCFERVTVLNSG